MIAAVFVARRARRIGRGDAKMSARRDAHGMSDCADFIRTSIKTLVWPALPGNAGALALALQFQLEQTQWWSPAQLASHQMRQLQPLARHAYEKLPLWRERLAACGYRPEREFNVEMFCALPLLSRAEVQSRGEALICRDVPPAHGAISQGQTSGSTGTPVTYNGTALTRLMWTAFSLRDHLWHRRDFSGKLAAIRLHVPEAERGFWGPATDGVVDTGPFASLNVTTDVEYQLAWLERHDPHYLLSLPSNVEELARRSLARKLRLPHLREVRTIGEALPEGLRGLVREAWGVKVSDIYSAQETGYIALQCPDHEQYHVQAEGALIEIVADDGTLCGPGQTGHVVITPLHNFAMPLFRYRIGDLAEPGPQCECGRGLPVIRRIHGRVRNMVSYPDGRKSWPSLGLVRRSAGDKIRQFQCIQRTIDRIDLMLAISAPLTRAEEDEVRATMRDALGHPFEINLAYCDGIARSASGKFEEFRSEL